MAMKDFVASIILKGRDLLSPAAKSSRESVSQLQDELQDVNATAAGTESGLQGTAGAATDLGANAREAAEGLGQTRDELEETGDAAEDAEKNLDKAFKTLGVMSNSKIAEKIREIQDAYDALSRSGTLSSSELEQASQKAASKISDLQSKLAGTAKEADSASDELMEAGQAAEQAGDGIDAANDAAGNANSRFGSLFTRLKNLVTGGYKPVGDSAKQASQSIKESDAAARGADNGISQLTRRLAALAGTYLTLQGLKNAVMGVLGTGDELERYRKQLDSVMGSIEGGATATEWLRDFQSQVPAKLGELTQGFIALKNFGLDPMDGSYQAIIDQAAKLGGSQETLSGITLALGQAWSKQKLQGEEILQLVERGVPVWDLLSKATGKNTVELQKMSEAGQLGRREISALIAEMGAAAKGAAADQLNSLSGLGTRLSNIWTEALGMIADSGLLDYAKQQLKELIGVFTQLKDDGTLQRWASQISSTFVSMGEAVKNSLTTTFGSIEGFKTSMSNTMTTIGTTVTLTGGAISLFAKGIASSYNLALITVTGFTSSLAQLAERTYRALGKTDAANELRPFIMAVNSMYDESVVRLGQHGADIQATLSSMWDAIGAQTKAGASNVAAGTEAAVAGTKQSLEEMVAAAQEQQAKLSAQVAGLDAQIAKAASSTTAAWQAFYAAKGAAESDALAKLNAAIAQENNLRVQQAAVAEALAAAEVQANELVATAAKQKLEEQAKATDEARGALARLGVDVNLAMDEISTGAKTAIDSLDQVADSINQLGPNATQSSAAFKQAITGALGEISSSKELDALQTKLRELLAGDQINAGQFAAAMDLVRIKAQEIANTDLASPFRAATDAAVSLGDVQQRLIDQRPGEQLAIGYTSAITATDALHSQVEAVRSALEGLSAQTLAAFDAGFLGQTAVNELDAARAKLGEMAQKVSDIEQQSMRLNAGGIGRWMNDMQLAAAQASQAFYEQKVELLSLVQAVESGGASLDKLNNLSRKAKDQFDLLDDTDLSRLNAAIDTARRNIESLNSSAASTLASLRNELDQLNGETDRVQQRNYDQQRKQLEEQLKQARDAGAKDAARDLEEALKAAEELHRTKMKQLRDEEAARRQAATEQQARQTETTTSNQRTQAPGQRIVLQAPNGRDVEVQTADPGGFLSALEAAGLRSAS